MVMDSYCIIKCLNVLKFMYSECLYNSHTKFDYFTRYAPPIHSLSTTL